MKEKVLFSVFLSLLMLLAISPRVSVEAATHTEALLYAGQHTVVGEVVVWNDGENLYVKYTITESGWYLVETHLEVATNLGDIPQTRNGNPIPGHFTYKNESHTFGTTEYTYVIPLENWEKGDELYIAAHAEVVKVDEVTTGNLVYNGDFEIPDIPYGEWNIFDSSVVGWGIEWYDGSETYNGYTRPETPLLEIHDHALGFDAYSGDQYAELDTDWDGPHGSLNGEPASVKIYQNLEVDYGGYDEYLPPYTCDLSYAWRPRTSDSQMEVYWGGSLIASHADSGYEWHHEEISGLTLDGITELAFIETGTPDSLGMFLDAVNVTCNGYAVVQEETAWADGTRFVEKGNWGMYFTYTVQGWELIDTIEVPSTTPEPTSTNVDLEAGHLYKIEAVGTYFFRHEGSPSGYLADAEWAYRNDAYGTGWTKGDDYPNSNGLDLCINDDSTNIDWGPLNEDTHTYSITYIPTATGPISFFIRDSYYGDNSGSLMVYIYEWK